MTWTIPNLLTLFRILLIPVLVLVFYLPFSWAPLASAVVFFLAAVTDALDGYLARKWEQTSAFGAFLDPVADKLMVAVALVLLTQSEASIYFAIPAAIIICREIAISALREWMAAIGERTQVAVSTIGKIKTMTQMIAVLLLLYHESIASFPTHLLGMLMLYASALLTLWSMIIYLRAAWPVLVGDKQ
ncbi:MAG: CDP-diacylglycerol--glycerol-3-phosphate 3-phosphatidyltransferase [Gammaproteobacteria bacterium]|nr:CDP-diacylglycerol--glycerol-3-phosphate 3-phosphatidyltransferase [Gammaproteobacteria bacterium]